MWSCERDFWIEYWWVVCNLEMLDEIPKYGMKRGLIWKCVISAETTLSKGGAVHHL